MKNEMILRTRKIVVAAVMTVMTASIFTGCGKTEEVSNINPPVISAMEKYGEIISGLSSDQYYGFAAGEENDLLLVTDGVYDNLDGNMATIDAKVYSIDANGNVIEVGEVSSDGTAYPIAVYDDKYIMTGGNHRMEMSFVKDGSIVTQKMAHVTYDTSGNATYDYYDLDENFEGVVEDDSKLMAMYEDYGKAVVVNFNQAQ